VTGFAGTDGRVADPSLITFLILPPPSAGLAPAGPVTPAFEKDFGLWRGRTPPFADTWRRMRRLFNNSAAVWLRQCGERIIMGLPSGRFHSGDQPCGEVHPQIGKSVGARNPAGAPKFNAFRLAMPFGWTGVRPNREQPRTVRWRPDAIAAIGIVARV
jgi:hypothetical protein